MDSPLHVTCYDKTFTRTAWLEDLDRIHEWMSTGRVLAACIVCTPM